MTRQFSKFLLRPLGALLLALMAAPAVAAPLLLVGGDDKSVVVLDLPSRETRTETRAATLYFGRIAEAGRPQVVTGERHQFDCPGRRERKSATLARNELGKTVETADVGPWRSVEWQSPMDYAMAAVCLDAYDRNRVSARPDVPSILSALEDVLRPAAPQPPMDPRNQPSAPKRPWWRPI